ncbi:Protein BFR2 [Abortiporus biennis]
MADTTSSLRLSREEDVKKGKSVLRQNMLWESLLDLRIQLQKAVGALNDLPPISNVTPSREIDSFVDHTVEEALMLTADLKRLHHTVSSTSKADITHVPKENFMQSPIMLFDAANTSLSTSEVCEHAELLHLMSKWFAKMQSATGSRTTFAPNRHTQQSWNMDSLESSISNVLQHGEQTPLEANTSLLPTHFDDKDLYQQMLNDILTSSPDAYSATNFADVRRASTKKVVDTKASKGRKIRYEVHEKLEHFMTPVTFYKDNWHSEQIDDLFVSLPK